MISILFSSALISKKLIYFPPIFYSSPDPYVITTPVIYPSFGPMLRSLALLQLAVLSHAFTTFDTICSAPSTTVNYVSSADTRGTVDILWSCLFTIIACTWTVQHLNIPEQREGRDPGWLGDIKWGLKRGFTSTKWMLATVIAPEVLLGKYLGELADAGLDLEKLRKFAAEDGVPWTLSHCFFANMGGFVLRTHASGRVGKPRNVTCQRVPDIADAPTEQGTQQESTLAIEPDTLIVPTSYDDEGSDPPKPLENTDFPNPYHLTAGDILALRESSVLTRLPYISPDELQDRSKSDSLVRTIAVGQILWVSIQILIRAARHLAISQLEIAVVAFASCAVAMYGLNWYKPKGVEVPITIMQYRGEAPRQAFDRRAMTSNVSSVLTDWTTIMRTFLGRPAERKGAPISNVFTRSEGGSNGLGLTLGSLVFGGIHLAAWKFEFPTRTEQILCRSASLWCTCFCVVFYLCAGILALVMICSPFIGSAEDRVIDVAQIVLLFTYVVARLFLLVEVFRTLCFLPPGAYVATWASNVPHIS
jgi:hypothetical protein